MRRKKVVLQNVVLEKYAAEGQSLARVDGKVIFVENTIPGDEVDVLLKKNKKDWGEGVALQFHKYSDLRVKPFCQHFGVCGGCQWQMLPYAKQLEYKQQQVVDNLQRIARIQLPEIQPIIGAHETREYRNKMEYTFANKRYLLPGELNDASISGDENVAGFHARGFFDKVVPIVQCHLQSEPTNRLRNGIAEYAKEHGLTHYDIRQHHGFLRNLQVRLATTGELMVNLVVGYEDEALFPLLEWIKNGFPEITTLLYTINPKKNDSLYDLEPQVYTGKGFIIEKLEDYSFKISPKSFFQTNTRQGEKLYQVTREYAELDGSQVVYDLYCGTGSIGIFVSKQAKKIVGVEVIEDAIADAKENAALNELTDASFFAGDVIDIVDEAFFEAHGKPDVVITDPPRAGMHEKLVKKLLEIAAPTIVYVSCNPATQARDLALLDEKYVVTKVQPVDMFPHTLHIENVVQLKLR
ncbi:23S rRNA (uracil(1939)-C(5))-methyltransferase RlmD [Aridibaculum aurantiacum]|uniref:23S rRNA (uracil(1939)-C(5))-methyltransferase RlmD n=1 Tax=Aridibaculum aurantiacum TaxID=2810307 RepID=UPI001A95AA48|nr:23S rRNA (uracil(1939)-C(5))-methyltransferase RlmD [Aridibaculum aurantiacum]